MLQQFRRHSGYGIKSGQRRRGPVRFFYALFLTALCSVTASAAELNDIARLAKGGASQLALALLDKEQPEYAGDGTQWMRWERMRVRILEQRGEWQRLKVHLAQLPAGLPEDFRQWAQTRRARALILGDHPVQARQLLRALIWGGAVSSDDLPQWRQLVMQSYLREGRVDDAYVAMLRYHQDYGEGGDDEILMRARVLFASGHPAEARSLLAGLAKETTAGLLLKLARLRSGESAESILAALRNVKGVDDYTPLQRYLYYGVMAEAAAAAADPAFVTIALEKWYAQERPVDNWSELFRFSADRLWRSYLDYGLEVGNNKQLLIGNDEAWFKLAADTEKRYPVRKRSLYAVLAQKAFSPASREKAGIELVHLLQQQDNGMAVVQQLFLNSSRYDNRHPVPPGVAYLLVDQAIREGNLSMASRLMRQLPEPPKDVDKFPWQMRRVKVFILAGDNKSAVSLLRSLLPLAPSLGKEQRDQFIQLLFDLQNIGDNESAYRLLNALYQRLPNLDVRRELLFWMGDSRVAQKQYVAAARLYLRSATLIDTDAMDPWAQTARYKAAQTLAKGGMLDDAAYIYTQLLRVTKSPDRRAVLHHELEQVRMRQASNEK